MQSGTVHSWAVLACQNKQNSTEAGMGILWTCSYSYLQHDPQILLTQYFAVTIFLYRNRNFYKIPEKYRCILFFPSSVTGSTVSRSFLAETVRIIKQWGIKLFVLPSLFPPKLIAASAVQNEREGLSCVFFLFGKMVSYVSPLSCLSFSSVFLLQHHIQHPAHSSCSLVSSSWSSSSLKCSTKTR